jgi:uncharacterized protein (TIGR02266 family)
MAALFLARAGRVVIAANGAEALTLAGAVRPDLVVADVSMPGLDGGELCRRLKSDPRHHHVPVVLLLGRDCPEERARAVRAGADDVLPKPVERLPLLESARRLLEGGAPRGLRRISLEAPVRLRQRERAWDGTARNLSRGGVFVETAAPLPPPRAELDLELELPETPLQLASTAEVIWTRPPADATPPGMGLRFLGLERGMARLLSHYVAERLPALLALEGGDP